MCLFHFRRRYHVVENIMAATGFYFAVLDVRAVAAGEQVLVSLPWDPHVCYWVDMAEALQ
jgi:hypothetical protein